MLIDSDSGLNLMLGFDNSSQKVVTRTMLNQEGIFRNQVLELHRLYGIQKTIMKDDSKLSCGESPNSFLSPFSEKLKKEPLAMEMKLREVKTICSLGSVNNHSLKEHRGPFEHQKISLDLKLSGSNQYANDSGHLFCDCNTMKHSIYDDKESSIDVLELSLRVGGDTWEKGSGKRTCKDKIICSPSLQAFHLRGSTYSGYATHSGVESEFEASCSFRVKNDCFDWSSRSLGEGRANVPDRKLFYQGIERCHGDLSCNNLSAKRTRFTSHEEGELDLNKALPDEPFLHPIDPRIFNPPQCTSSGVSHSELGDNGNNNVFSFSKPRQPKNNRPAESSALDQQDVMISTLTISPSKDLGSICGPLSDFESGSKKFRLENAESEIHLPNKACQRISELKVKKNKEDNLCSHYSSQELLEVTDSNPSPVSWKSDLITDDESSNIKTKTGHCLIDMPNSESSLLSKKNVMPWETKSQSCNPEKEKSTEVDATVKKGAVSLVYFSMECLDRKRKERCNSFEKQVPEISSESFESIVLKQHESSIDEYCVSSTPLEATSMDRKDNGVMLRRGRRMKDFRKDILPSLASLSRQEINEDIKVMELALRSREYKKYRSNNAAKTHCISSRRSRLRSVTPRYCS